jgi:hypothetical protein
LPVPTVEELEAEQEEQEAKAEQMRQQIAGQAPDEDEDEEAPVPGERTFTEPFSPELIQRGIDAWNALAPDRFRGVLEADIEGDGE